MNKQFFLQRAAEFAKRGFEEAAARNSNLKLVLREMLEQLWCETAGSRAPTEPLRTLADFNFESLGAFVSAALFASGETCVLDDSDEYHGPIRPFYPQTPFGLEEFLEEICAGITFLQFRAIERAFVRKEHRVSEFYDGKMVYASQALSFLTLWEVLVSKGLVEDSAG
jgi:hypothetical protein